MKLLRKLLIAVLIGAVLAGCAASPQTNEAGTESTPVLSDCPLKHCSDHTGIFLMISIDEFNKLGFQYGDSVDLSFSNGYALSSIPYYTGYYGKPYETLLVAYPSADYIKVSINYGADFFTEASLSEDDTCTITLHEPAAYHLIQEANAIHYEDDRSLFASDEVFANFRSVCAGTIRDHWLYRSASPCDNRRGRAAVADRLAEEAGIRYIIDLSDTEERIQQHITAEDFNSPYFLQLYKDGRVLPLNMSMRFTDEVYRQKINEVVTAMAENEGPYLLHCVEGKDRTGFLSALLEALCGADYAEIEADYMKTYDNYYGINQNDTPEQYQTIREQYLNIILEEIVSDDSVDVTEADLASYAYDYLVNIGIREDVIRKLQANLQNGS